MQLTDMMKSMEATLERLTPSKAQDLAKQMMGGEGREQVSKLAQDLMDWSQRNRERLVSTVQREVKSQLKAIGVATREEVDALRKRVRDLERAGGAKRTTAKKTTKKPAARRPAATRSSSSSGSGGTSSES